jgi:predicted dehydrogenase
MKEVLFPSLRLIPRVDICSVTSHSGDSARVFAGEWQISSFGSGWQHLVENDSIDAIVCSGPLQLHEELVTSCLNHRKALFVEKPAARSLPQYLNLENSALSSPLPQVQIGYNLRFAEGVETLRAALGSDKVHYEIDYHVNKPKEPLWGLDSLELSFFLAILVHPLSLGLHLLGDVKSSHIVKKVRKDSQLFLEVELFSRTGSSVAIRSSNTAKQFETRLGARTATGRSLWLENLRSLWELNEAGEKVSEIWRLSPLKESLHSNGYARQLTVFRDLVLSGASVNDFSKTRWIYEFLSEYCEHRSSE